MKLFLEHLGAKTFMVNAGIAAFWTGGRYGIGAATGVSAHLIFISVEDKWKIAVFAESLPTAVVADS